MDADMATGGSSDSVMTTAAVTNNNPSSTLYLQMYTGINIALGIIGIWGNSLVLVVAFWKGGKIKKTLSNPFLINLTFVDLMVSLLMLLTFIFKATGLMLDTTGFCIVVIGEGLVWMAVIISPVALIIFTMERYFMVVFPVLHKQSNLNKVKRYIIAFSWLLPCSWNIGFIIATTEVVDGECLFQGVWPSMALALMNGWVTIIMTYLLPILIFIYCYTHMLIILHKRKRSVLPQNLPAFVTTAMFNITITLLYMCICFVVLWTPSQIYWMLYLGGYLQNIQKDPWSFVVNTLAFTNSVINPFIYVFRIKEFQNEVVSLIQKGRFTNDQPTGGTNVSSRN